ncbi:hypothetical protein CRUP_037531, partial [Coryphaenoides rupestris]
MFGGKLEGGPSNVTDELWVFNIPQRTWSQRKPAPPPPHAQEGHSAHLVESANGEPVMVVFFGYSPVLWTSGALVQGGSGHSSVYDRPSGYVFLHGGYKALSSSKYGLVDHLYRYHVHSRTWLILRESGQARYLHSAVLISGTMLVFGGNTHNDTSLSNGAKCFSGDFLAYDIACNSWTALPRPGLHRDTNRFGHSAVVQNGSMYLFGGFSGLLLNDVLAYTPPSCLAFAGPDACAAAGPGVRCHWIKGQCFPWEPRLAADMVPPAFCPIRPESTDEQCFRFSDCASCTANTWLCQWCEDRKCISASSNCTVPTLEMSREYAGVRALSPPPSMLSEHQLSLWKHGARRRGHWDQQQQECHTLPGQLCGEDWQHIGEVCLRINSSRESYDNAQHYCKNLGGNIASLVTEEQVDFVLQELHKYQLQGKDSSAFSNTSLRWLPGEPSDSGFCASLEQAHAAGLKANPCTAPAAGLICEKPALSAQSLRSRWCRTPCSQRSSCAKLHQPGHRVYVVQQHPAMVPLLARVDLADLSVSRDSVDFGLCYVGLARLANVSLHSHGHVSYWRAVIESSEDSHVFSVTPNCGVLRGPEQTLATGGQQHLQISFTASEAREFRATVTIQGPLIKPSLRLCLWGRGSYDEALLSSQAQDTQRPLRLPFRLRWLPGEPSDSGFCASLEQAHAAGLKANPCTAPAAGLICEKPALSAQSLRSRWCRTPCSQRSSCANCTSQGTECMWCSSTQRCVDSSAYVISFPYGQCLEWQTQDCT